MNVLKNNLSIIPIPLDRSKKMTRNQKKNQTGICGERIHLSNSVGIRYSIDLVSYNCWSVGVTSLECRCSVHRVLF